MARGRAGAGLALTGESLLNRSYLVAQARVLASMILPSEFLAQLWAQGFQVSSWRALAFSAGGDGGRRSPEHLGALAPKETGRGRE